MVIVVVFVKVCVVKSACCSLRIISVRCPSVFSTSCFKNENQIYLPRMSYRMMSLFRYSLAVVTMLTFSWSSTVLGWRWFLFFFTSHISSFTCHWYFLISANIHLNVRQPFFFVIFPDECLVFILVAARSLITECVLLTYILAIQKT